MDTARQILRLDSYHDCKIQCEDKNKMSSRSARHEHGLFWKQWVSKTYGWQVIKGFKSWKKIPFSICVSAEQYTNRWPHQAWKESRTYGWRQVMKRDSSVRRGFLSSSVHVSIYRLNIIPTVDHTREASCTLWPKRATAWQLRRCLRHSAVVWTRFDASAKCQHGVKSRSILLKAVTCCVAHSNTVLTKLTLPAQGYA